MLVLLIFKSVNTLLSFFSWREFKFALRVESCMTVFVVFCITATVIKETRRRHTILAFEQIFYSHLLVVSIQVLSLCDSSEDTAHLVLFESMLLNFFTFVEHFSYVQLSISTVFSFLLFLARHGIVLTSFEQLSSFACLLLIYGYVCKFYAAVVERERENNKRQKKQFHRAQNLLETLPKGLFVLKFKKGPEGAENAAPDGEKPNEPGPAQFKIKAINQYAKKLVGNYFAPKHLFKDL